MLGQLELAAGAQHCFNASGSCGVREAAGRVSHSSGSKVSQVHQCAVTGVGTVHHTISALSQTSKHSFLDRISSLSSSCQCWISCRCHSQCQLPAAVTTPVQLSLLSAVDSALTFFSSAHVLSMRPVVLCFQRRESSKSASEVCWCLHLTTQLHTTL